MAEGMFAMIGERFIIGIGVMVILSVLTVIVVMLRDRIEKKARLLVYMSMKRWRSLIWIWRAIRVVAKHFSTTNEKLFGTPVVNIVFDLFCEYYEHELAEEADNIEYVEDEFPNKFADVYNMYRWIADTRARNYDDLYSIEYDEEREAFSYCSQFFEDFEFKLRPDGELKIYPIKYSAEKDKYRKFIPKRVAILQKLYELDSEKCTWIIQRRKYFSL